MFKPKSFPTCVVRPARRFESGVLGVIAANLVLSRGEGTVGVRGEETTASAVLILLFEEEL